MSAFVFDLRCAVRSLRRHGFTSVAILALALAIGSNTALFSIANATLLQPLPYSDPSKLIIVHEINPAQGPERLPASAPNFVAWRRDNRTFEGMAAFRPWTFTLTGGSEPERVPSARVSVDLFPMLGIAPILGRAFLPEEDQFGSHHVVLVSEGLWRRRFDADPRLIGQRLLLNGESYIVVGVVRNDSSLIAADLWVPLGLEPFALQQRGTRALTVLGRLRAGVTHVNARADLALISDELSRKAGDGKTGWELSVTPLHDHLTGTIRPTIMMIWCAVALVLLIACANTASLLLASTAARQKEIAVSFALGASPSRIVRRLLTESVLLALLGGVAGIPLAVIGLRTFASLAPAGLPRADGIRIDLEVLVFTFLLSALTGILFGLTPAVRSLRTHASSALKETASSSIVGRRSALGEMALAGQVALAVVVLVAAGLLVRSFKSILAVDLGFQTSSVLTMSVSLSDAKYGDPHKRAAFFDQFLSRIESMPNVEAAGLVSHLPLAGRRLSVDVAIDGHPRSPAQPMLMTDCSAISADYFRAMRIPLVRGRPFTRDDSMRSAPVVIINEEMARRLWPNADPIGRRLMVGVSSGADPRPREVVGVATDIRPASVEAAPGLQLYVPVAQNPWPTMTLAVRSAAEPVSLSAAIRTKLLELDRDQPVFSIRPMDLVASRAISLRRFQMLIVTLFAAVGLILATVGVYSVVSYSVRLRTQEIGLRVALGASPRAILVLALRSGLLWAAAGIATGSLLALWVTRLLSGALFGIAPTDPATFFAVISFTAVVVMLVSCAAGRRAVRLDPLVALRSN